MNPLYPIFLRAGGWIAILVVWLGFMILASGISGLRDAALLASQGEATTARIFSKSVLAGAPAGKSDSLGGGTDFYLEYRLDTPEGPLDGKAKVERRYFDSVTEGETVPVRYLSLLPEIHELYAGQFSRAAQATTVVGGAFTTLGLLLALGFGLVARRGAMLLARGEPAEATVLAKTRRLFLSRLRYGFRRPDGRVQTGKSFWRFWRAHRGIKPRDLVDIRFNSDDPRVSFWQGDLGRRK